MNKTLSKIAAQHLGIETLATMNSDRLDFHNLAVWQIRAALQAAYDAGAGVMKQREAGQHQLTEDQLSISVLEFPLIKAAANGLVDLNVRAREEMATRGLDLDGRWVGFGSR